MEEDEELKEQLYSCLPELVRSQFALASLDTHQNSEETIKAVVKSLVPSADVDEVEDILRKLYTLSKTKRKKSGSRKYPRLKKTALSVKEREELGLYKISKRGSKYADFLPLHDLWRDYMRSLLDLDNLEAQGWTPCQNNQHWEDFSQQVKRADYHGCVISVTRSKCPSLVGRSGIILFDTKNTLKVIGEDNVVRTIPKEGSMFRFRLDSYVFTFLGKHFCVKPTARSVKKVKKHVLEDL